MTKNKKGKSAKAVEKIARKTIGLVARVGDALEAAAAAVAPVPLAPPTSSEPTASPAPLATPPRTTVEVCAADNEPSEPGHAAVSKTVEDGARAVVAIEAYATVHNLRAVDIPGRVAIIAAVTDGAARHGSKFTEADVWSLIDEQMRIHFRTLGANMGARGTKR